MQLLALVDGPDHVCCRYRLAAFEADWARAGHALALHSWPRRLRSWPQLLAKLRGADAVILQRKLPSRLLTRLLRRMAKRFLFDFDDAVFGRDSYAPRGIASARRMRRFEAICAVADAVIAGNAFLAESARKLASPERVHVVPTCVDPSRYPLAGHERQGRDVQLVWLGSSSTLRGLEAIRSILEEVGRQTLGLRLKIVCDRFLRLEAHPVIEVPWSEACEAAELASADIGISWMPDDDWSRGKCGLKVLQYMAAGLPVVANPVGVHVDLVRPGKNGFLAESQAQWLEAIARLATDPNLRRRMGAVGRRRVEAEYTVADGAEKWNCLLHSLESRRVAA